MKDPKKLKKQRPDYVRDPLETDDMDRPPLIGSDPEEPAPSAEQATSDAPEERPRKPRGREQKPDGTAQSAEGGNQTAGGGE